MSQLRAKAFAAGLAILCSGCTSFDPLDQRGETINQNAADYANNAELLNLVRASLSEPLTFVSITGLDGTSSATASVGFPTFVFGPHGTSPRDFNFGPNTAGRTNSNTFHVSVVDDPGSFAALMAPLNPAMIGFFRREGYANDLLFWLFVDRIREVKKDANGKIIGYEDWINDPNDATALIGTDKKSGFVAKMGSLLAIGLTAEVDTTTLPTGHSLPPSKLCFDPNGPLPAFVTDRSENTLKARGALDPNACDTDDWLSAQSSGGGSTDAKGGATDSKGGSGGPSGATAAPSIIVGKDGALWIYDAAANSIVRVTVNAAGEPVPSKPQKISQGDDAKHGNKLGPIVGYPLKESFRDTSKPTVEYQVFMRSTYGIYAYLGAVLHKRILLPAFDLAVFNPDEAGNAGLLDMTIAADDSSMQDCFAKIDYRDVSYCVPNKAVRTKQIFSLLHQLQELNTAPSNAPTTLTVTNVP